MSAKGKVRVLRARLSHGCGASLWAMAVAALLASSTQAQDEDIFGKWEQPPGGYDWVVNAVHAVHLSTGKILVWLNGNSARLWDPGDGSFTSVPNEDHNVACSGHAGLADGSVLAAGGGGETGGTGTDQTSVFGLSAVPWEEVGPMSFTRWYPTCTTLPDGKVLAIGGKDQPGQDGVPVEEPEIYDPDPAVEAWGDPLGIQPTNTQRTYPFMFVLPDGDVFFAGPGMQTSILVLDPSPFWFNMGNSYPHSAGAGSAVMFKPGWVLKSGGTAAAPFEQNLASWIDLNVPSTTDGEWELVDFMVQLRRRHNLVVLPDGKILAIGGENNCTPPPCDPCPCDPVFAAEWFDPDELIPVWRPLAAMTRPRARHSTAVLLPDGTVLACGGTDDFPGHPTSQSGEIFSPPYLFDANGEAPRPVIGFAPTVVQYGQDFRVVMTFSGVQPIDKVSFLRLAAVTHSVDQNQRFVPLDFVHIDAATLEVTAPANGNDAPPGYYMLFLVSDDGVPSVAKYVQLIASVVP